MNTPKSKPEPINVTIPVAMEISGYSRSEIYRRAKAKKIILKKNGRSTLVDYRTLKEDCEGLPEVDA